MFRLWPSAKGTGLKHPLGSWGSGLGWVGKGVGLTPVSRDKQWQKPLSTLQAGTKDACGFCVAHEEFCWSCLLSICIFCGFIIIFPPLPLFFSFNTEGKIVVERIREAPQLVQYLCEVSE